MSWGDQLFKGAIAVLEAIQKAQQKAQVDQQKAQAKPIPQQQNRREEGFEYDRDAADRELNRLRRQVEAARAANNPDSPSQSYPPRSIGGPRQTCPNCGGTREELCHTCDGRGYFHDAHGQMLTCQYCYKGRLQCKTCLGAGRI